jgi:hypothetical protein
MNVAQATTTPYVKAVYVAQALMTTYGRAIGVAPA